MPSLAVAFIGPLDRCVTSVPQRTPDGAALSEALTAAARGDRAAFARLFHHFAPRVKAYLIRLGAGDAAAEDLMQDVMLTVWRRAPSYDPTIAGASTWIFTIARNRRIDALRRAAAATPPAHEPALLPATSPAPDDAADALQWEDRIANAMATLPPEQAEMLRLAYFEERSHSEIAARLRAPLGTVKSRLRLAIARLRATFDKEDAP